MSDEVRKAHRRIWALLPGPATVVMGAVVALPASLRVDVVRCLVRAKPLQAAGLAVALHAFAGERCARAGATAPGASLDRGVLAHEIADAVPGVVAWLLSSP